MKCPHCGEEIRSANEFWSQALVKLGTIAAILVGYQITLAFFVTRYDYDELRNILLLAGNIILIVGGKAGIRQLMGHLAQTKT